MAVVTRARARRLVVVESPANTCGRGKMLGMDDDVFRVPAPKIEVDARLNPETGNMETTTRFYGVPEVMLRDPDFVARRERENAELSAEMDAIDLE